MKNFVNFSICAKVKVGKKPKMKEAWDDSLSDKVRAHKNEASRIRRLEDQMCNEF